MATIVVVGGTGYTGANIAREAASRGHAVVSVSRSEPAERTSGVRYELGAVDEVAPRVVPGADVVVAALSPRGDMAGRLVDVYGRLVRLSAEAGARYLQVGGFSSLRPAPGAPRFVEGEIPAEFREEALEGEATRTMLVETAPEGLDWLFISPAGAYGSFNPGEGTGRYRVGGEVALFDAEGNSAVSGADFALAVVDEIERPAHHRAHIGIVS
jgi:putative NADH-flavin reductase